MPEPKVSIGLPVFNGANYLAPAIQSIIDQTYRDFELIISDNASTDSTPLICAEFAARDRRIRYSRLESNCGAAANYRRVFEMSTGTYFKWQAHDDVCLPSFVERCVTEMEGASRFVVLAYPRAEIIGVDGQVTGVDAESIGCGDHRAHRRAVHVIRNVNVAWAQFGLIRSAALRKTRLIDSFIGSDYVLLAELAMLGPLKELPEVLFQKRVHPGVSNVVHRTRGEWLAWMDPSQSRTSPFPPSIRIGLECVRSSSRLPLSSRDRVLCQLTVPTAWYWRKTYQMGSLWKDRVVSVLKLHA